METKLTNLILHDLKKKKAGIFPFDSVTSRQGFFEESQYFFVDSTECVRQSFAKRH